MDQKDETEFNVKLSPDGRDSKICRVPKPVRDFLDNPKSVKFVIDGNCILALIEETNYE